MSLIDRYILREFLFAFGFALVTLVGIFWIAQTVQLIDSVLLRGGGVPSFLKLSIYLIPHTLSLIAPLAALIGMVFAMNRLAQDAELLAMTASGRVPTRNLRPAVVGGLVVMILLVIASVWLAPLTRRLVARETKFIVQNFETNIITSKEFTSPIEGLLIYAEKSELSGEMLNVFISDQRTEGRNREYYADRGLLLVKNGERQLALIEGVAHSRDLESLDASVTQFERLEVSLGAATEFSDDSNSSYVNKSTSELFSLWRASAFKNNGLFAEMAERFALPFLGLVMPVLGALGFILRPYARNGHRKTIIITVVIGVLFELFVIGSKAVIAENIAAVILPLLPIILAILATFVVMRRARGIS